MSEFTNSLRVFATKPTGVRLLKEDLEWLEAQPPRFNRAEFLREAVSQAIAARKPLVETKRQNQLRRRVR